jgi:hypothetical protein
LNNSGEGLKSVEVPTRLYLGGYEDYLDPPFNSKFSAPGPYRIGLFDDLIYYLTSSPFETDSPSLLNLSNHPLRIIAAEWVKYIAVMQASLKQYEYTGSHHLSSFLDELTKLHSDLRALQSWRRRIMSSQQKLVAAERFLKKYQWSERNLVEPLMEDYSHISYSITESGRRLEAMLPVVTSLVQIVDTQRSFAETANISRLTVLALVFVPLTFVSSIFSMNVDNGPGGKYFWVYFVVAIPVTLVVLAAASPAVERGRAFWKGVWRRRSPKAWRGHRQGQDRLEGKRDV